MSVDRDVRRAWNEAHRVARRQLGLFTYRQAIASGLSRHELARAVERGHVERWYLGVYALPGVPPSWERRALAAQLAADILTLCREDEGRRRALLSHRSAAYLHRFLDAAKPSHIEMTVPRGTRISGTQALMHTTTSLRPEDRVRIGPFEVTSVERTICDLAAQEEPRVLLRTILDRWRRGATTPAAVSSCLCRMGRVRGSARLRMILAELDEALGGVRSAEEGEAYLHLTRAGLPAPRINHRVSVQGGRRRFVVDLCYPDLKIAIEVDGRFSHSVRYDHRRDRERQALLEAEGWRFVRVTTAELAADPAAFVARVRAALAAA